MPEIQQRQQSLYLELLKEALMGAFGPEEEFRKLRALSTFPGQLIQRTLAVRNLALGRLEPPDWEKRRKGQDWPQYAHTMVGKDRLDNVQFCVEDVLQNDVPGDLVETGVWRGGTVILMRAILAAHGINDRTVWAADSFEGLPAPDAEKYPADASIRLHAFEELAISQEQVEATFARYGLLDDQVRFVKGWFKDTLPHLRGHQWAVLRLDGDLYESTIDALVNLYPDLSPGGYVIVDDYGDIDACRRAVEHYRAEHRITEPIQPIDHSGVYWQRED